MIATLSVQAMHWDESVSTCRFAQRVALVHNTAKVNEEQDPYAVIQQLKMKIKVGMCYAGAGDWLSSVGWQELRHELGVARGQVSFGCLFATYLSVETLLVGLAHSRNRKNGR